MMKLRIPLSEQPFVALISENADKNNDIKPSFVRYLRVLLQEIP